MPTFSIHTLGCRANQADSEQIAQILAGAGFNEVPFGEPADCQIVNSCTVTREADRKSAQMVRRASRLGAQVVLTGCGASQKGGAWQRLNGIPLLRLPPDRREEILSEIGAAHCPPAEALERQLLRRDRARNLLRIQEGCDQFCTFCIVPYVRGRARSRTQDWVLEQIQQMEADGVGEIVLSGIHLSAWGSDFEARADLADLTEAILQATSRIRVRLSSVEPDLFPIRIFELFARYPERLCPHLHLVLQHASDPVLERMHRGYTLAEYDALVQGFLKAVPDGALSSDIMVGFPGETDADFNRLMSYVRRTRFARIHVFPYSPRPGTAAARFSDQVDEATLRVRRDRLLRLAERKAVEFQRSQLGAVREVLLEQESERAGWMRATTDNFVPVWIRAGERRRGERTRVQLVRRGWGAVIAREL